MTIGCGGPAPCSAEAPPRLSGRASAVSGHAEQVRQGPCFGQRVGSGGAGAVRTAPRGATLQEVLSRLALTVLAGHALSRVVGEADGIAPAAAQPAAQGE